MQNVRNSSVITYIKYLRITYRITLSARAAKTVSSDWTCSNVRELLTLINTMIRQRIKDYIYIFIIDTRCS